MEKDIKKEDLIFTDTSVGNKEDKAVLGTLEGPCADIIDCTRNGRHYSESLWEKTFDDPIVTEMIDAGGIPGELDHPTDRAETDSSRIAILLREKPKKKDGKLWAKFDILNTPLGKIAYTLAKAGFKLGVSSRGQGDTYIGRDGIEEVDESSYDFKCFDLVLLPSVKAARLNLVTESLDTGFDYRKALNESLSQANEKDRKLMESVLDNLNISYQQNDSSVANINEDIGACEVADNESLVKNLQEALKKVKKLENQILDLQEKLSVSYTKEAKNEEQMSKYKKAILKLSDDSKKIPALRTINEKLNKELEEEKNKNNQWRKDYERLVLRRKDQVDANNALKEDLNNEKQSYQKSLQEISQLREEKNSLTEDLKNLEKDLEIKKSEYSKKLSRSNSLVEKYKGIAQNAVDRYIKSQAIRLGISSNEIKNKLSENYTFDEIDEVCKDLQQYKLNMAKLPFNTSSALNENIQMKVKSSKKENLPATVSLNNEDDIDDQLLGLAGLN